jgi:transketolase
MERTHIGYGAPTKQDTPACHGAPLGQAEVAAAKARANWPPEEFHIAEHAREPFKAWVEQNRALNQRWQRQIDGLAPERARRSGSRYQCRC